MSTTKATKEEKQAGCLLGLIGLALFLPLAAWAGFAISTVWGWFIVPLGVPRIGVWAAAGIYLLARYLTTDTSLNRDDERSGVEKFATNIVISILLPAVVLLFGALYHALAV